MPELRISMQETLPSAWKSEFRCGRRCRLHRNQNFDAGDAVVCMEIGTSMQETPSSAWKSELRCRGHRGLHRNRNFDAGDTAVCIEIGTSMQGTPPSAWKSTINAEQVTTYANVSILRFSPNRIN